MSIQRKQCVWLALIGSPVLFVVVAAAVYGLDRSGILESFHEWAAQTVIYINPTMAESNGWF